MTTTPTDPTGDLRADLFDALWAELPDSALREECEQMVARLLPAVESYGRACAAAALRDAADHAARFDGTPPPANLAHWLRTQAAEAQR